MPHCVVEYSANLVADGDIAGLLEGIAALYAGADDLFPTAGIRVRAIEVRDYVVADGAEDRGFVHLTCTIMPGRPQEAMRAFFGALFELAKAHFAPLFVTREIGLSLDVETSAEGASHKHHNIRLDGTG